jgi:hypothetical protein
MKTRHGFVSNSSSQSFIVLGRRPPASVESTRLDVATAKKVVARCIAENKEWRNNPKQLADLQRIDPEKDPLYLTRFLADSGEFTEPLRAANHKFFYYCDGSHGGPYDEDGFVNIGTERTPYGGVWVRNEDYVCNKLPKGQLELSFCEENDEDYFAENGWDDEDE